MPVAKVAVGVVPAVTATDVAQNTCTTSPLRQVIPPLADVPDDVTVSDLPDDACIMGKLSAIA